MSAVWKIGPVSQPCAEASTFAALGMGNLRRSLTSAGLDQVTLDAPSALALTDDLPFSYKQTLIVWKDGLPWFSGLVTTLPRSGRGRSENRQIVLSGPWWYFQECTYMQSWIVYDVNGRVLNAQNKCRIVLFQGNNGSRCTSGAQVGNVVDWLIARGAPIAKGVIDAGITLPFDEQVNLKCSAVIDSILRWTPDYCAWFDYSAYPPVFNFRKQTSLAAASLTIGSSPYPDVDITPRYDLQKPGVVLNYEKSCSANGANYNTVENDTAGDTDAIDCVYGVFDLQGPSFTTVSQKMVTEDYPEPNDKTWWRAQVPWLAQYEDADIVIHDHTVDDSIADYTRFIKSGIVQDWMDKTVAKGCIRAKIDIVYHGELAKILRADTNIVITREVVATDAETMTYSRLTAWDTGEQTPQGVASALWSSWGVLHYQGTLQVTEDECSGAIRPGMVVNLAGGRAEWQTMNAIVQRVTESVDTGATTIQFGPAGVVEADTLVALFRALRSRRFSWQAQSRTTGTANGAGDVQLSGSGSDTSPSSGGGETKRLVVSNVSSEDASVTHDIDHNPAAIAHADSGDVAARVLQAREVWVPQLNSNTPQQLVYKLRQVLCSEAYHSDQLVGGLIRLSELLDVLITSVEDGDTIRWDAASSKWINGPASDSDFDMVLDFTGTDIEGGVDISDDDDPSKLDPDKIPAGSFVYAHSLDKTAHPFKLMMQPLCLPVGAPP